MANSLNKNNNTNSYVGTQSKVKSIPSVSEIDRVNVYEFEHGMDIELTELGGEINSETIKKAQAKVLSNLKKDSNYYTNKIVEETIANFGEYGSGKKKKGKYTNAKDAESVKAEVKGPKDETPKKDKDNESKVVGKIEKTNVSKDKKPTMASKPKEMTQTPKKAKGIKSTMDLPGKEKKINLKENREYKGISEGYSNATNNELASYIGILQNQINAEKDSKKLTMLKQDLKDVKDELKKRKSLKEETSSYPMPIEWVKQHYRVEKSPEGIKIFRKSDNKEVSLYDVGEHYEKSQDAAYDIETRDNSGIIKSTMKRQVSQPIKSFDQIVKNLKEDDEKVKRKILPNKEKNIADQIPVVSTLDKAIQYVYKEPNLGKAKELILNYLQKSKINSKSKKNMIDKIELMTSKPSLDKYLTNALLSYERLNVKENNINEGKIKLTKENINMIQKIVSEVVAGYVAVKPGDITKAKDLTTKGFNVKFDDSND
jgi:hypothetical protein